MGILIFERQVINLKGYSTKEIMDPNYWLPDDYEELKKIYRTLAKSADQRLVRLESYQHDKNFKPATKWAYARAMHDIEKWSGEEAQRFNTAPPKSKTDLLAKINDIKHFLESPTSTKKGIIDVYKKRADSLNKTMRASDPNWKDLTWKDLAQYFDSALNEKLDKKFGSKTALKNFNAIKRNEKQIVEDIKEKKDLHIKVENELIETTVNNFMKQYPDAIKDFFNIK